MTAHPISVRSPRGARSGAQVYSQDELVGAINKLLGFLNQHVFGGPTHMLVVTELTKVISGQQRSGLVTTYEIGAIKPDSVQVLIHMPVDQYTAENRRTVRSTIKSIGYRHGLYVDPHLMPDECDGAAV